MSGYSVRGASVGSDDASTGGANHGEVSLISLGLSGFEAEASRWMARGLCAGPDVDPTWWEVESMHGAGDDPSEAREDRMTEDNKLVKKAQMICRRCPVRQECGPPRRRSAHAPGYGSPVPAIDALRVGSRDGG